MSHTATSEFFEVYLPVPNPPSQHEEVSVSDLNDQHNRTAAFIRARNNLCLSANARNELSSAIR